MQPPVAAMPLLGCLLLVAASTSAVAKAGIHSGNPISGSSDEPL
jgi:hypothetical protein